MMFAAPASSGASGCALFHSDAGVRKTVPGVFRPISIHRDGTVYGINKTSCFSEVREAASG